MLFADFFCYLVLKIHNKLENSRGESSNIKSYCLRLRTWFQFNHLLLPPQLWYYQLEIKIMFTFCSHDNHLGTYGKPPNIKDLVSLNLRSSK